MSDQDSSIPPAHGAAPAGRLQQALGVAFGVAIIVGNSIAVGILATPGEVAGYITSVPLFLGAWVAGGLYALIGSMQLAELGCLVRRSGGQYVFSRRALGPYAGFIVGWSDWLSTCGTNSAVTILIGRYLARIFPSFIGKEQAVAVAFVLAFTAVQWRDIHAGRRAQEFTTLLKGLVYVFIVAACFVLGGSHRAEAQALPSSATAPETLTLAVAIILAVQAVIYTYDGWSGPIYFSEEVKDPGREIPRSTFAGVFSVMAIYVSFNLALVYILPLRTIAGDDFAIGKIARLFFGPRGDYALLAMIIVSLLSSVNSNTLMATRVLFAMSRDGLVSRRAAAVNAGGTPVPALVVSTLIAVAFIFMKELDALIEMLAYFFVANYAMSFLSLFVLRRKQPDALRPYRAWGYPFTTGFALVGALAFLVSGIVADLKNTATPHHSSILALGLLVLSYPAYRLLRRAGYEREGE
ncbi:MAG TPA: APC family permease [Candidatus Nitrosotalea sp.]|nr:APC family permease [Candidatus Nitrosotalea sp.]